MERSEIDRMLAVVRHRGPDGFDVLVDQDLGLGHARLKILDLSAAADQPMGLPDGSLWLSYNGEIHNFVELRADLARLGVVFRTSGDTEVVLHALHRWGEDAFERFNGMWAIALWAPKRRRLLLARDRFGIKPLFWSMDGERLAFASEAKSILAAFPDERRWSPPAMNDYLRGGWTDAGTRTFFANIQMLAPGRLLVVEERSIREQGFWRFDPGRTHTAGADHSEELRELLDDAVRIRIRSDVPVGVCLSGGLDSSAVASLVARHVERPVQCFSLRYPGSPIDESAFAQAVASSAERLELNWVEPRGEELIPTIESIVWHHDAPTVLRGRYPQWHVLRAAAAKVTVVLGGQGADELFAGYSRFVLPYLLDTFAADGVAALPRLWRETRDLSSGEAGLLPALVRAAVKQRYGPVTWPGRSRLGPALAGRSRGMDDAYRLNGWLSRTLPQHFASRLNNALWHELTSAGLPELLRAEDVIGMAFSLESRLPFLDHRIVELAFRLCYDEKIGGGWTKQILRRATRDLLPGAVRLRRLKLGFPGNYSEWFGAAENVEAIREILLDRRCLERGVLDPRRLQRDLGGYRGRATAWIREDLERTWRSVAQELWFRAFIE